MKIRHTLCAIALSAAGMLTGALLLSGFVPRDEGPCLRRPASSMVARLRSEDMPRPIQSQGDAQRQWAFRGPCVLTSREPDSLLVRAETQSGAVRFLADAVVLGIADRANQSVPTSLVPLLTLDGFSQPLLFAALPETYADLINASGQPLSWLQNRTLHMGYTPLALHRSPLPQADAPILAAAPPLRRYLVRGHGLERARAFQGLVQTFARRSGLDPMLINAIIYSESNFNTSLVSPRSAVGLMQVCPILHRVMFIVFSTELGEVWLSTISLILKQIFVTAQPIYRCSCSAIFQACVMPLPENTVLWQPIIWDQVGSSASLPPQPRKLPDASMNFLLKKSILGL